MVGCESGAKTSRLLELRGVLAARLSAVTGREVAIAGTLCEKLLEHAP